MARPKKESAELEGVFAYADVQKWTQEKKAQHYLVIEHERSNIEFDDKRSRFEEKDVTTERKVPIDFLKGSFVNENGHCPDLDVVVVGIEEIQTGIRAELEF